MATHTESLMAKVIPLFSSSDILTFEMEAWDNEWNKVLEQLDDGNVIPF